MSFQAYLDNIKAKTGKSPRQLKDLAAEAGVLNSDMKANELVAWLKNGSLRRRLRCFPTVGDVHRSSDVLKSLQSSGMETAAPVCARGE